VLPWTTLDSGWFKGALTGQCGAVGAPCDTGNPGRDERIGNAVERGGTSAPVGVGLMHSQVLADKLGLTATPANQNMQTGRLRAVFLFAVTFGMPTRSEAQEGRVRAADWSN
jgi:hypothetical protein